MSDIKRVCEVCDCPQFHCASGWVCRNGHGGADWYPGKVEDYSAQRREWTDRLMEELRRRRF